MSIIDRSIPLKRRTFLKSLSAGGLIPSLSALADNTRPAPDIIRKAIPATGETLPVIGMGTWITFNVGNNTQAIDNCRNILAAFFAMGGTVIDSSPMYGSAEATLGKAFERTDSPKDKSLFSASKIWTSSTKQGPAQFANSMALWNQPNFDLFQVHNLLNWREHITTLQGLKEEGLIRYVGITTSHGRRHNDFMEVMQAVKPDFIQVTYNAIDREVEKNILPLAADLGIAVLINRPFQGGRLFDRIGNQPLPQWAGDIGCDNWAQLLLKFVVSHPAVTCAIPATSQVAHMQENMGAQIGVLPDTTYRERIAALFS